MFYVLDLSIYTAVIVVSLITFAQLNAKMTGVHGYPQRCINLQTLGLRIAADIRCCRRLMHIAVAANAIINILHHCGTSRLLLLAHGSGALQLHWHDQWCKPVYTDVQRKAHHLASNVQDYFLDAGVWSCSEVQRYAL